MNIRSAQNLAWENKLAKGFNTTDVPLEFCLLQGELAEAFEAWRKGEADLGEELADIAIYLFGLAQMTGIDLQAEVESKLAKNVTRVYRPCRTAPSPKSQAIHDRPQALTRDGVRWRLQLGIVVKALLEHLDRRRARRATAQIIE